MIAIVDNGKGADQIAGFVRRAKEIVKPSEALKSKADGFILSDGDMKNQAANIKIIKSLNKPLLAVGSAYIFLAVAYGAKIKESKLDKMDTVKVKRSCPLTLDLKKVFMVMQNCSHVLTDLPQNFETIASSSKYEFKIIQEMEKPFFGVHFNPELGKDGLKVLDNFVNFVEFWGKYHR